ncbi:MAG: hypothetical protein F6K40_06145 [Okeania sp. SIO3I5]|uniref:hypothetical protein n=1 Tax=Okeania sp. SIO3I5 TaxID=2607805 RepID=UPI0013B6CF17|nr:hypothetical protein [Okeania sp. SIO3I5]NEQ35889.1 hypothetical protein [Okeania sp. SIO3I5]
MLLKSEEIHNQEQLVSILKNQLEQATSRLTDLKKIDSKFQTTILELETLLEQHPDYQSVVSDRLKYKEPEPKPAPVKIEIMGEEAIAEMEEQENLKQQQTEAQSNYSPEELEAYDSLHGETPPQPTSQTEEKIESPCSSEAAEIAKLNEEFNKILERNQQKFTEKMTTSSESKSENLTKPSQALETNTPQNPEPATDSTEELLVLHSELVSKRTRTELESFKAEIGEAKTKELWELCTIPERNYLQCLGVASNLKKAPATLGHRFQYTEPGTKIKRKATYLGYYLHGELIQGEDKRAILVEGEAIICDKSDLRPAKHQPLSPEEREQLEKIISEPEIAANTFTGVAPAPKPQTGTPNGNKPNSEPSKPSVEVQQMELSFSSETEPTPEPKEVEVVPTPLLELAASEVAKINPTLTLKFEKRGKEMVMEVLDGTSYICRWEDINNDLWPGNAQKLKYHGFSEGQIDAISDLDIPKA